MKTLKETVMEVLAPDDVKSKFIELIDSGLYAIKENPTHHICVYFAAYDPQNKLVFIGHHKKSGLWLFNGGHIENNETPAQTAKREMMEEWGIDDSAPESGPSFLSLTEIYNPAKQTCRLHYDIWFFVPKNKDAFFPDASKLAEEFFESGWKTIGEAKRLVTEINTLAAIAEIEKTLL